MYCVRTIPSDLCLTKLLHNRQIIVLEYYCTHETIEITCFDKL